MHALPRFAVWVASPPRNTQSAVGTLSRAGPASLWVPIKVSEALTLSQSSWLDLAHLICVQVGISPPVRSEVSKV